MGKYGLRRGPAEYQMVWLLCSIITHSEQVGLFFLMGGARNRAIQRGEGADTWNHILVAPLSLAQGPAKHWVWGLCLTKLPPLSEPF